VHPHFTELRVSACFGCSGQPSSPPPVISTTFAADETSPTENDSEMLTADGDVDNEEMDVDAGDGVTQDDMPVDQTCDKDDRPSTSTDNSLLPDVVELSAVDSELRLDAADDDWLTSLLRYDDEATDCSNADS